MPHGVDQLVLFPSSNFRAATIDNPPVWTATKTEVKGRNIRLSAKRMFKNNNSQRQMEWNQTRQWALCFYTGKNAISACSDIMQMNLPEVKGFTLRKKKTTFVKRTDRGHHSGGHGHGNAGHGGAGHHG